MRGTPSWLMAVGSTMGSQVRGLPVLFVHGWALGQHAYKRALKRLVHLGCRVYAPALPGFGGSTPLPPEACHMAGYAAWVDAFLDAVGVEEPVFAIGHSFGGGVVTKLAHDFPARVGYLVLINSVGGGTWLRAGNKVRSMAERPLWDWAVHFPCDLLVPPGWCEPCGPSSRTPFRTWSANPIGLWRVGMLARRADLTSELADLQARRSARAGVVGRGRRHHPPGQFRCPLCCRGFRRDGRTRATLLAAGRPGQLRRGHGQLGRRWPAPPAPR